MTLYLFHHAESHSLPGSWGSSEGEENGGVLGYISSDSAYSFLRQSLGDARPNAIDGKRPRRQSECSTSGLEDELDVIDQASFQYSV